MRLSTLFFVTALSAMPAFAAVQMAEHSTPATSLHPHSQPAQHEIFGDGQLPQQNQGDVASAAVSHGLA